MASGDLPQFKSGQPWSRISARKMQRLSDGVADLLGRKTTGGTRQLSDGTLSSDDVRAEPTPIARRAKITGYDGTTGFTGILISGGGLEISGPLQFRCRIRPIGDDIQRCLPNLEDCFNSSNPDCWEEVIAFQQPNDAPPLRALPPTPPAGTGPHAPHTSPEAEPAGGDEPTGGESKLVWYIRDDFIGTCDTSLTLVERGAPPAPRTPRSPEFPPVVGVTR